MRTKEDLETMRHYLNKMEKAVSDGTSGEEADLDFHLTIAKATNNSLLVDLMNNISELMKDSMKETRKIFIARVVFETFVQSIRRVFLSQI